MNTGKNLHSHATFDSPVSGRQEVSGFGDNGDGDGGMFTSICNVNIGDNWVIECDSNDKDGYVFGKTLFYLHHRDTKMYLYTDVASKFT